MLHCFDSMSEASRYRFAAFELDVNARELRKNGMRIKLQDQPLTVLQLLIERQGELVTREEIRNRLWPADTFVDFDRALNTAINRLREALGDQAENPRFVETLPRRGYRFVFPVQTPEPPLQSPVTSRDRESLADSPSMAAGGASAGGAVAGGAVAGGAAASSPGPATETSPRLWLWRIGGLMVISAALTLYFTGWRMEREPAATGPKTVVAVLPFPNRTGDAAHDYFSEGLTQKLIARLGHTSISVYQQSGKDLGAQYVIEGAVKGTIAGDSGQLQTQQIQIDARLTRTAGGPPVWSKSYVGDVREIQRVQVNIADELAAALIAQAR